MNNREAVQQIVGERNAHTLNMANDELRKEIKMLRQTNIDMSNRITSLGEKIGLLERQVTILMVSKGSGPTA